MSQIFFEIDDKHVVMDLIQSAKEKGLLQYLSVDAVEKNLYRLDGKTIRIPVNVELITKLCANPIVKKAYGKKIEEVTIFYLKQAMGLG